MKPACPKCGADQNPRFDGRSAEQMEGRDWHCPACHEVLMMLSGRISVIRPVPPGGGSPLPPAPPGR